MTRPIIALDFATPQEVQGFLRNFSQQLYVKVGMEYYLQNGPDVIRSLKEQGHSIFLDLKLHDIPTTVHKAMKGLAGLGVDMVNVHAAGGIEMMRAAKEGLIEGSSSEVPKLIAVTQLTSTTELQMQQDQLIQSSLLESVLHYASCAHKASLDGVVCSVHESTMLREKLGSEFYKVTPGIRLAGGEQHDQKRVATPADAKTLGSTHIVVGRAITASSDPVAAYHQIKQEWSRSV
ncbi:orotidine-5'-phosphate decarboxylase [Chryseomicrobium sp. FSL W7-1435]|uniref:orotidine-5'-phosphate decarboxylase n=1 Tax=Chryseomicrobium sp. FSL W7-1435 TaxID=2921704 RepID=UPI003159C911